jgi:hypothetical protein
MGSKRKKHPPLQQRADGCEQSEGSDQKSLWFETAEAAPSPPARASAVNVSDDVPNSGRAGQPGGEGRDRRTIQDLLFGEGVLAAGLADGLDSLAELQKRLIEQLPQNSLETRIRYAQSVLKWFFPNGLTSLGSRVAAAYHDEAITADILRCCYLMAEPIVGACVADCLFPLEVGIRLPAPYLDRFLRDHLGEEPPARTRDRLKTNLMRLGFLGRSRGQPDQLLPVNPTPTATLLLVHHLFAPTGRRTIELRNLFAHPFWKYLGCKSPDAVRNVLRDANAVGLLGKYIVADQLEQVTTCFTLDELLTRRVRL